MDGCKITDHVGQGFEVKNGTAHDRKRMQTLKWGYLLSLHLTWDGALTVYETPNHTAPE